MRYGRALAAEPHRRARDRELRAELLRLHERAAREELARDAGREAEVVLDPRARSGLAAGRAGLEHEHVEPLGRARRPRPRDRPALRRSRRGRARTSSSTRFEPQALAGLLDRRLLEDALAAADEDRNVVDAEPEGVERRLHLGSSSTSR